MLERERDAIYRVFILNQNKKDWHTDLTGQ
jgi:hypothetical protein